MKTSTPVLTKNVANTLNSLGIHLIYHSAVGNRNINPSDLPIIEKIGLRAYDAKRLGIPIEQLDEFWNFQQCGCQCKATTLAGKQCLNMAIVGDGGVNGRTVEEFKNRYLYCHAHQHSSKRR